MKGKHVPPRLTRRRLIQALAVGSAAMALQGCNTLATLPSMSGVTGRITGSDRRYRVNEKMGQRPWSPEDQQNSERAQRIVGSVRHNQPVALVTHELAHPDRLPEVEREWDSVVAAAQATGSSSLNQHFTMAMLATPILAQHWLQENQALFNEAVSSSRPTQRGDLIEVPPGTMVRARFAGSCMDDKMPAPARGEPLVVRPAKSYIHPNLEALNTGVSRLRGADEMSYEDYQHLVWAIRNAGQKENPFLDSLQPRHVELLNRAAPGGHRTLLTTHTAEAHNPLNDLADGLMNEFNQRFQLNLNGQSLGAQELFDRFSGAGSSGGTEQAVSMLLDALTSQEAEQPVAGGPERGFSMLNDHVAVEAIAADRLDPELVIVNAGVEPFIFDPTKYVLESPGDTQRVGLPSRPIPGHFEGGSIQMEANEGVDRLGERVSKDLELFMVDSSLREAVNMRHLAHPDRQIKTPVGSLWSTFQNSDRLGARVFQSAMDNRFGEGVRNLLASQRAAEIARYGLRHGADYLPIVGNLFSLYELVAGHHILERDNPSSMPERGLAAIGVIPGGKAVAGIGRTIMGSSALKNATNDLSRRAAVLLRQYSQSSFVKGVEESAVLRDIAWWTLSDSHEILASDVDDRLDSQFSRPWNETIGYVKSL